MDSFPERSRAELEILVNEYQSHRSAKNFVVAAARLLGADATPALFRKLDVFLLDGHRILVSVDENGRANSSLVLIKGSSTAEIVVLRDSPDQSPSIRSTEDLRRLLLASSAQTRGEPFSGLTGCWPSCIMELLQLEIIESTARQSSSSYKRLCMRHLRSLSKIYGILPPSFILHTVVRDGNDAVCGGGFADVWKGRLDGQLVCLKCPRLFLSTTQENRRKLVKFCREALVWKHLNHPNVLAFLGVSMELLAPRFCLVSPWMSNGSLLDYLEKNPDHDRMKAIVEVAKGMSYLHTFNPVIVHADIRGANILVTDQLVCCLADFGLATAVESQRFTTTTSLNNAGTVRWMAPELFQHNNNSTSSRMQNYPSRDIYAFGCSILEIATSRPPFDTYTSDVGVINAVVQGERPSRPREISSDTLWNLVTRCWETDPGQRPSSRDVVLSFGTFDISNAITYFAQAAQEITVPETESAYTQASANSLPDIQVFPSLHIQPPVHNIEQPSWLTTLGNSLYHRFQRLGDLSDINESITKLYDAVRLTPDNHPERPKRLNHLGTSLLARFEHLGLLHDLNESVIVFEDAVRLTPDDHPDKPFWLSAFGNSLYHRFQRVGDLNDLHRSVQVSKDAVSFTPDGHPQKPTRLNYLGVSLLSCFERLGDHTDLNDSVRIFEDAVRLTPDGHPDKPSRLNSLSKSLACRFEHFGDITDINRSITILQNAVHLTPDDHPHRSARLQSLGDSLAQRSRRLDGSSSFAPQNNLQVPRNDVAETDDSLLRFSLDNSANTLHAPLSHRSEGLRNSLDTAEALCCYMSAARAAHGSPLARFGASIRWAKMAEQLSHESQLEAYSTALFLLPQLAWSGSTIEDRQYHIRNAGSVVSQAALVAINNGEFATAVQWLEQGRSIVWRQLLGLRAPIDSLKTCYPNLAMRFEHLSRLLEEAATQFTLVPAVDYNDIAVERENLLSHVRQLPGFERFLLPEPLSQLTRAAELGPVVMLNISGEHCDALVLLPGLSDDVMHIPLPSISLTAATNLYRTLQQLLIPQGRSNLFSSPGRVSGLMQIHRHPQESHPHQMEHGLQAILLCLWKWVVEPIVQGLALVTSNLCRIWWCPTGVFSFLPLHAAGDYSPHAPHGSKLTDYAISSYIPSLTSLIQTLASRPMFPEAVRILAVGQSSARGQLLLPGVRKELELLRKQVRDNVPVIQLVDEEATVQQVKEGMKSTNWVHFACHGMQDVCMPTKSCLLLAGSERLTLSEIIKMKLPSEGLAFLSACETATGDKELSDEVFHLAAGMLFAGYRGVIATMWQIRDDLAPHVANDVYEHLFQRERPDPIEAAAALHYAVKNLQERDRMSFLDWVSFIHVGL